MKKMIVAAVMIGMAYTASASLLTSYTGLANLSSAIPASTQSVAVAEGDMVVMVVGSNKKVSVTDISFSTTASGSFTDADAALTLGSNPNPNAYISYLSISTAGTYDFIATASQSSITANVGLFVLTASSKEVALVGGGAAEWTALAASASLSVTNTLSWAGSPTYGAGQLVTVTSSLRGTIANAVALNDGFDGGPGKRISGGLPFAAGTTSIDDIWNITNAAIDKTESGSATALAFVEVIPEPTTFLLLGLGSLALLLRRRR